MHVAGAGSQDTSFGLRRKKSLRVSVEKEREIRSLGMPWTDNAPKVREVWHCCVGRKQAKVSAVLS